MNLTSLYRRLSEFQSFRSEVEGLIASLKSAVDPLSLACSSLNNTYLYDDVVADNGRLKNINKRLDNVISSLENNIIPAIDRKISRIESSIDDLIAEMEAAAAEEES